MKVRQIRITTFKRFTDTTIEDIPIEARLVVLVGPNGSGKSSVIDAAYTWHRHRWAGFGGWDPDYHGKQLPGVVLPNWNNAVSLEFHDPQPGTEQEGRKAIYVRTAYRNDPEFQLNRLSRVSPAVQENRFPRLIDNDQVVGMNYMRLVAEGFQYVYETGQPGETLAAFRERSIGAIRDSMQRLFPDLVLNSLGNPLTEGTFRFNKGESQAFLYKNLSGGEKAAFDLLLDVLVKRREFDDTVFFIDEPEGHMATGLQGALLEELFSLVPENSQLWIATHSIGMMRRARDIGRQHPGQVVFLDFDGINFDVAARIAPTNPDRPFWKRAMQVALDDIAGYVAPERVVLCEGGAIAGGQGFDASCYNIIFGGELPDVLFLGAGNSDDIQNDPRGVGRMLQGIAPDLNVIRLIDRDDRTDDEIAGLSEQGVRVLTMRTIESYLLDDEVLEAVCDVLGDATLGPALIQAKEAALEASVAAGAPADDFKRISGDTYNAAKQLFPAVKLGSNKRAFMLGICAPQVPNCAAVYQRLRDDIFGE